MRNYNYYVDNKMVIYCTRCLNKLRVPLDKGKISVKCPVCSKEFIYNPNSIFDTLKQAALFTVSKIPRDRKSRVILGVAAALLLVALFYLIYAKINPKAPDISPKLSIQAFSHDYL